MLDMLQQSLASVLTIQNLLVIALGVTGGIIFGAIPGLTATMGVALCLPLTYSMSPLTGIALMIAVYVGGTSGGLISAILLKMPGTPSSVATTFDGGPMAERGEAGKALGAGILYSFIGTMLSILALIFIAPALAKVALKFGPYEMFAICIFALTLISSMVGKDAVKGVLCAVLGLILAMVGFAPIGNTRRFTFGFAELEDGFDILPVMIGLFAVSEILSAAANGIQDASKENITKYKIHGFGVSLHEFKEQFWNMIRSALLGIGIGILPGIGGATANIVAYSVARSNSKYPEKFGTGILDGVVASETSNNASIGGALIPLLTLGIPGDTVTAMILGGLMMKGIAPGPLLFQNSGVLVYGVFIAFILSTIAMLLIELLGIRGFVKILEVPKRILLPAIFVLCVVGTYGANHQMFDVWTALAFGVVGFFMKRWSFPFPPLILGLVLGGIIEENLLRGLMYANGNFLMFFSSPIAAVFMLIAAAALAWSLIKRFREKKAQ